MGGDLNLKKSWHPHLIKNQTKVWQEEKRALEERKLIEKMRKEREEERAIEELQKLQEASGGPRRQVRVDWMYSGNGGESGRPTEETESYLLGKRRIDSLLRDESTKSIQKGASASIDTIPNSNANTARDTASKISNDPMLLIKKRQMEMQLNAARAAAKDQKEKSKRDDDRRSRRHNEERDRKHRHRHHHSRRDRSRSRDSDERDKRDRRRSRSPRRRRDDGDGRNDYRRRSRSPYRRDGRDRSRSPPRRSYDARRRSRSPRRQYSDEERPRNRYYGEDRRRPDRPQPKSEQKPTESAAEKLARMQADAKSLEEQRDERVRQREAKDALEESQHKKSADSGRRFINSLHRKTEDMDLGDVIARGRQGYRKEIDV
ncbi:hypothetical protein K469DRAFT_708092 [Zopfia rhizophila CBS 207.26]|uniref:CBF1-interacting co-repressor CIR N-terminal domain-containing protein n=1 Tax=Zopfia rhizophila CBS 207.26 TaxID=1314779 RepID=A0A6A6E0G5_9PEZI|nr:hypothetical protein K469DRAFT_708092 [Zopfia rhizophila CBS 207.26]